MKTCSCCKEEKTLSMFGLDSHRADKLNVYCKICVKNKSKERYPFQKKRIYNPENSKRYRKNLSPENKSRQALSKRRSFLKQKYGITLEMYISMLESQNHKCAICDKSALSLKKALAVDHNHITDKVRGLVCAPCNRILGFLKIDVTKEYATNLMNYVQRYF